MKLRSTNTGQKRFFCGVVVFEKMSYEFRISAAQWQLESKMIQATYAETLARCGFNSGRSGELYMSLKFDFSHHSFLITGGARGIGLEIALAFLESGARVAIWDFSSESIESARKALNAHSSRTHFQTVDITSADGIREAVQSLPFDINGLINNAGITRDKSFAKMTAADFDAVISTNLRGVFLVTQSLLNRFAFSQTADKSPNAQPLNWAAPELSTSQVSSRSTETSGNQITLHRKRESLVSRKPGRAN